MLDFYEIDMIQQSAVTCQIIYTCKSITISYNTLPYKVQ